MNVGDQVVFPDDEPVLDLPEGTPATVIAIHGPGDIEFQLADSRVFTTLESSLGRTGRLSRPPNRTCRAG